MAAPTRAERLAANRAAIARLLAGKEFTVHGVREPRVALARASGRLEYVEVGRCAKCRFCWRTNGDGVMRKHGPSDKPCKGSYELPSAHTVVLKDLYVPGERWPKGRP